MCQNAVLGPDHAEVAISLNNLAALYQVQGWRNCVNRDRLAGTNL